MADVIDPKANELVWRGAVTDTVSGIGQSEKQANQATERGLLCFSGIVRVHHERPEKESCSERDKAMKSLGFSLRYL